MNTDSWTSRGLLLALTWGLAACSGGHDGAPAAGSGSGGGGGSARTMEEHFTTRVQPNLGICRTCHVPDGVADVEGGKLFQLSRNSSQDLALLRTSWERLGGNNPTSRILRMASGAEPHSGGALWPQGGDAYKSMDVLLRCFADPAGCPSLLAGGAGGPVTELPLLGSKRARHVWATYCEGKPNEALLPTDPRSLVRPGANEGKAVYFNAFYEDCHVNAPVEQQQPKTCGDYRARRDRGFHFLMDELPGGAISAEEFNNTWQKWGLSERPANFEELYTLRYGLNPAPYRNPYPKPGEDPNKTDGGSGQLPIGLRQLRDEKGQWTGQIASGACFMCHGGNIGDPAQNETIIGERSLGIGNSNYDVLMAARDGMPWARATPVADTLPPMDGNTLFNIGIKQRGQNNAVGAFEFLNTLLDLDSLGVNPNPLKTIAPNGVQGVTDVSHPLAHTQDTPAWWNMGSRPRKFFDAGVSNDSTRIIMSAGPGEFSLIFSASGKPYRDRIEEYDQDLAAYFLSLESPPFPGAIDEALASQGAILFHTKDLWAHAGNKDRPRPPGGNGSCASCHGAYSPRFVNDARYLANPAWEGIAAHISPLEVIGTDRARSDMLTPTLREQWDTTYWGYPEGVEGYVAPEDKDPVTEALDDLSPNRPAGLCGWEKNVIGYQAPPLYGIWATAPYFHNGSVPTIEQVLKSDSRPILWQRQLRELNGVKGFDISFKAYDQAALGWKHKALSCSDMPGNPLANCNPANAEGPSLLQLVQNFLGSTISWAGLVSIPDPMPGSIDKRLVYDTRTLGNGNGGHEFSDVLTDQERRAILEYLKTL